MLKLIALVILWPIGTTILTMIFNTARVKAGADINDWLSQMLIGVVWGPIGIFLGLFPFHFYRFVGGVVGTYWAYQLFHAL